MSEISSGLSNIAYFRTDGGSSKLYTQEYVNEKDKEIDRLKDLCNKYEEEHKTAFKLWTQKIEEMPDYEERMKLKKEVIRLNNIINELEKYIGQEWYCFDNESIEFKVARDVLDKLKELKENNNGK